MGTDIHLRVEARDPRSGAWVWWREPLDNVRRRDWAATRIADERDTHTDPGERNYTVFRLLAGVRAFNGDPPGLFEHRGIPTDIDRTGLVTEGLGLPDRSPARKPSGGFGNRFAGLDFGPAAPAEEPVVRTAADDPDRKDYLGDHSFTHCTLGELLTVPWDAAMTTAGIVTRAEYKLWIAGGREGCPRMWQYATTPEGPDVAVEEVVGNGMYLLITPTRNFSHVRAEWQWQPTADCAFRRWLNNVLVPAANRAGHAPGDVRILMGFDS